MEKDTYSYYLIELMKIVNCKVEYYIWIHESMNDASICERRFLLLQKAEQMLLIWGILMKQ